MIRVIEAFSGIGAQAKALKNIGIDYEIVNTIEWDVNAIIAYDLIHNGKQDLSKYENMTKDELISFLGKYTLSPDGKNPITKNALKAYSPEYLQRLCCAMERTKNLASIVDVKASELPENIQLLTYSFPCQDLSIGGAWHGNNSGIDRNAHNRSGMLWEVERILKEYVELKKEIPSFLLMENVTNILSHTHEKNFKEWRDYLESIGYFNQIYTLDASNFGIPQTRKRTYMLSVLCKNDTIRRHVENYFEKNNLEKLQFTNGIKMCPLSDYLKLDYSNPFYKIEADSANQNDTPSRKKIFEDNILLFDGNKISSQTVKTITTKQDRNPNSGVILYKEHRKGGAEYRTLTTRECFMLMGFDEADYQVLIDNDFNVNRGRKFCTREKLVKMAGNSIVVNVLQEIFKQVEYINCNYTQK